jgi:hypothetical protein
MTQKVIFPPPPKPDPFELQRWYEGVCDKLDEYNARVAAAQADSTASDVAALKSDFNDLLAKLRTAGLMAT